MDNSNTMSSIVEPLPSSPTAERLRACAANCPSGEPHYTGTSPITVVRYISRR
jgi:hypothetical protein